MRADRLVSILLLLQMQQRMTVSELARRLETSRRTIYRDMEALCAAGIPLAAERGTNGGWYLLEGYKTNLTGLSEIEVSALFLPHAASLLQDLGLHGAADSALIKVLAALPALQRHEAERFAQRIYVDAAGWDRFDEPIPWLRVLQEAVWHERVLHLSYRRRDDTIADYTIWALGLVTKATTWYLVGQVQHEIRVFRVSRIQTAQMTEELFTRPTEFELVAFWERWRAQWSESAARNLRQYVVQVRVAPALVPLLQERYGREIDEQLEHSLPADQPAWIALSIAFETQEIALSHILSFGSRLEVVEPQELREQLRQVAHALLNSYGDGMS